jgi:hypothetical protein
MFDLKSIDLEEIVTALSQQDDWEQKLLIHPESGELVFWTSDTGIDGQNADGRQ